MGNVAESAWKALCAVAWLALVPASPVQAGPCDAHFRFDGDLSDAGGSGLHGQLIVAGGEPATTLPRFERGKLGQALRLDGETVMYSPLDLQTETCPKVTIAAWIYLENHISASTMVSTGHGRGPRLDIGNTYVQSYAGSRGIRADSAVRRGQWIFVAGTWDYEARLHRVYWRSRWEEAAIPEQQRPPQEGFWVGGNAYYTALHNIADGLLIDELRVWGRVLDEDELREVQAAGNPALMACDCAGSGAESTGARPPVEVGYMPPRDPFDLPSILPPGDGGDEPADDSDSESPPIDWREALGDQRPPSTRPLEFPEGEEPAPQSSEDEDAQGDAPPSGEPRPKGAPAYSSVAGNSGGNKRTLDLVDTFFETIWWSESGDRPCYIQLYGPAGSPPRQESLSLGCDLSLAFSTVSVSGHAVGRVDVCNNDNANGRLKGIRIFGTKIEDDGSPTFAPISDEEALPNCRVWSPAVLCPGDKLATGLVVHSNDAGGNKEQIVGLQLVCRNITVE